MKIVAEIKTDERNNHKILRDLSVQVTQLGNSFIELESNVDVKSGSDLEYHTDMELVKLTVLTPFNDLKLYLNRKRTILVEEAKRMANIGIKNSDFTNIEDKWESMRYELKDFSDGLSEDFKNYNATKPSNEHWKLDDFLNDLSHALKYGNGSRDIIFLNQMKVYIKTQLEYTFKDYTRFKVESLGVDSLDVSKTYLIKLLEEDNIEMVLFQLRNQTQSNTELSSRLSLIQAQYNRQIKDKNSGTFSEEALRISCNKVRAAVLDFIKVVDIH